MMNAPYLQSIATQLLALHRWLLGVPGRVWVAAAACFAMNLASDLGNTYGDAPRFGGPFVAVATLLAFAAFFALAFAACTRWAAADTVPLPRRWRAALRWLGGRRARSLIIYLLLALALWSGLQTVAVLMHIPRTLASPSHYGSDEMYYAHYNAWLVLHGQNPYRGDHLAGALRYFATDAVTPLRAGAYRDPLHPPTQVQIRSIVAAYLADQSAPHPNLAPATTHSYPALSFLLALPSVWPGLPTLGYAQVAGLLAVIVALCAWAPARLRPLVVLLCLVNVDGIRSVAGSDFAIWTAAGVALVWLLATRAAQSHGMEDATRRDAKRTKRHEAPLERKGISSSPRLRVLRVASPIFADLRWPEDWLPAIALGLVCAVQQTAWFFAPFYLVWVWRRHDWRRALREGGIAVGAFVLVNLPWLVASPGDWARSLLVPVALPLFPTGGGLVGLSLGGALPLLPSALYAVLEVAAYLALLALYARQWARFPNAGMLLPLAALLLAWRSPSRYFILLPFLALLALVLTLRSENGTDAATHA